MINTFIHSEVPSKTISDSRPKWAKCIPVSDQNGAKALPNGVACTYLYGLYKGVPSPLPVSYPWFEGPSTVVVLVFLQLLKLKKCKFEKNASTPSKRARTAFEMKTFHWGKLKKKIEYSKKHNLKINTTCYVKADLHCTILGLASCITCTNKVNYTVKSNLGKLQVSSRSDSSVSLPQFVGEETLSIAEKLWYWY